MLKLKFLKHIMAGILTLLLALPLTVIAQAAEENVATQGIEKVCREVKRKGELRIRGRKEGVGKGGSRSQVKQFRKGFIMCVSDTAEQG